MVVEVSGRAWMIRQTTKQEKVVENIGVGWYDRWII